MLPMDSQRLIDLVDELRSQKTETTWFEFKQNLNDPEKIGKYLSALSNGARYDDCDVAYMVWGIDNDNHNIVGTEFDPNTAKVGNQSLELWLRTMLTPAPAFRFREIEHSGQRLIVLEIPAAISAPTAFKKIPYIRVGSATTVLSDDQQRYSALISKLQPYAWESGVAKSYVSSEEALSLLDVEAYLNLNKRTQPQDQLATLEVMSADNLITEDVGGRWNILNLGALLFARNLKDFGGTIERKGLRLVRYDGIDRSATVTHRKDGQLGYAVGFESLLAYINNLIPKNEQIGQALRQTVPLFPPLSVREITANALIHQDLTLTGTGPQVELFHDRIEITNPGEPLIATNRMVDLPPRSRNEALASLMRRMEMCEEQGSGLDKVFREFEIFQLPPPLLKSSKGAMQVVLYGPRSFANLSPEERVRACYWHSVLKFMSGEKMRNSSLCERLGIEKKNAAQATAVIAKALSEEQIKIADQDHPRAGYYPFWA